MTLLSIVQKTLCFAVCLTPLLRAGELEKLERQIELNPQNANLHFNVGLLSYQSGKLEKAESALRKAVALAAKDAEALELLGKVLQERGKWEESEEVLKRCLEADSSKLEARLGLGIALSRFGKYAQALLHFEKAVSQAPQDAEIRANLGSIRMKQRQLGQALSDFEKARSLDPKNPLVLANLCQIYNQMDQPTKALQACAQAIAHPSQKPANSHYNLGYALLRLGKPTDAELQFQKALSLDPHLASAHYNLGFLYYEQGKLEEAASRFRQAIRALQGNYPEARYNLAVVLGDLGRWEEAASEYSTVLERNPGDEDSKANLEFVVQKGTQEYLAQGSAAYLAGDARAASAFWEKALSLDPGNATAKSFLSKVQEAQQRQEQEKKKLRQSSALAKAKARAGSKDRQILRNAELALDKGELTQALRLFSFYVQNHPGDTAARRQLSRARSRMLRQVSDLLERAEATAGAERHRLAAMALALDPGNARAKRLAPTDAQDQNSASQLQALYFEGVKSYLKGDLRDAQKIWKKILDLDPAHLDAQRSLTQAQAESAALARFRQ